MNINFYAFGVCPEISKHVYINTICIVVVVATSSSSSLYSGSDYIRKEIAMLVHVSCESDHKPTENNVLLN